MKRLVFRVFGYEVAAVELEDQTEEVADDAEGISGGSGHDFERDMYPPSPVNEEPWESRLGFH